MKGLIVILSVLSAFALAQPQPGRTLVQAHRGYSERYPENTMLAFRKAVEVGADRIETDLALTKDGEVVLMHDRTVNRTTDGSGPVHVFDLSELRELDAGSWKDPAFAGEKVPTLRELLEYADGKVQLNLEIKTDGRTSLQVRDVVAAAVDLVHEYDAAAWVMFSSFDIQALLEVRRIDPELRLGLIDWEEPSSFDGLDIAIAQHLYAWSPKARYATAERVQKAKEAGLHVYMGSNPGPELDERLSWGADGVSANDPEALVDYLKRQGMR